jgi:oligopeptide/dipeptide ABC transporter ATP-binding protein
VRYFCDRIVVMYLGAVVEVLPDHRAPPRHPYTRALMASRFAPDPAQRRSLAPLTGEIPSPFALPPGCAFAGPLPARVRPLPRRTPALRTIPPIPSPASTRSERPGPMPSTS